MRIAFCIIIVAVILPKVILISQSLPLRTPSDEMGTFGVAAMLAGLPWENVIPKSGYYGYGMTVLLAWLFSVFKNPTIIYRIYLLFCCLLQSSGAFFTFYLCTKHHLVKDLRLVTGLSILAGYMVVTRANVVYNEHMLVFLSWLIVLLMFKIMVYQENKKKITIYSIILTLILLYSLTVHLRALIYAIAIGLVIILFWLKYRKCLVPWWSILLFLVGYFIVMYLTKKIQLDVWQPISGLRNSRIDLGDSGSLILILSHTYSWTALASIVIGQVFSAFIVSGGAFVFIMAYGFIFLIKLIVNTNSQLIIDRQSINIQIPFIIMCICVVCTITGQTISWLPQATEAIQQGYEINSYGTKAFTYVRYFGPYLSPVLTLGLVLLFNNTKIAKHILRYSILIFIFTSFYWITVIYPYISNTQATGSLEILYPFSFSNPWDLTRVRVTLPAFFICCAFFVLLFKFIRKRKYFLITLSLSALLGYEYIYNAIEFDINYQREENNSIGKTIEYLEERSSLLNFPIYVFDAKDQGQGTYFTYQFYLKDSQIIPIENVDLQTSCDILISNVAFNKEEINPDLIEVKVDDNQYIYISSIALDSLTRE